MSVRRVMGTEVEYGISVPGQPTANPTTLSIRRLRRRAQVALRLRFTAIGTA